MACESPRARPNGMAGFAPRSGRSQWSPRSDSEGAEPKRGAGWEVPTAEGKMAAAVMLAAGLCMARRALAVARPWGAQVRGGPGARRGSRGL